MVGGIMNALSFSDVITSFTKEELISKFQSVTKSDIYAALSSRKFSPDNFIALLSPLAENMLSELLHLSEIITRKRFGKTIQLFAPLYLSNECQNICTYCGFSFTNRIPRKTLNPDEIIKEAEYLKSKGFEHILLVTGEAPKNVGMEYFIKALDILVPMFSSVSMEVQPLNEEDYKVLHQKGVYSILVYQETYIRETYKKVHPKGKKSNYEYRIDAPDRICRSGMHHCGLGVLLGLDDWRLDSFYCGLHLDYLQKKYWKTRFSVSFPRIRPAEGITETLFSFGKKQLAQLMAAYRICFPDVDITLSTREPADFRDNILPFGITQMSAESKTQPGGYTSGDALEQFSTDDHRTLKEIKQVIQSKGFDPVMKNWYSSDIIKHG
jgi:2-iminoacetate synthase